MKYYNYYGSFENTLLPLISSKYVPDIGGLPCWISSEAIPFVTTLSEFKTSSNTPMRLFIEYYDNQQGYIRIAYDDDDSLTYSTVITYSNSEQWKEYTFLFTGQLANILQDGDFRLFASTAEDEEASLPLIIRRVGILREDLNSVATWQLIGIMPVESSLFGYALDTTGLFEDTTIQFVNNPPSLVREYGMTAIKAENSEVNPLHLRIGENDATFWRGVDESKTVNVDITYLDKGYHDVMFSYHTADGEEEDTFVTLSNTHNWVETTKQFIPDVDSTLYITSDTSVGDDPIVDSSLSPHTLVTSNTSNDQVNPKYGQSSILLGGITIDDSGDLDVSTRAFTMMFWVKFTGGGWKFLIEEGSDDNWWFGWYNGEVYLGYFNGVGTQYQPGYTGCDDGNWHHYYVGSDGAGTLYTFFDGADKQTLTYTKYGDPGTPLKFGSETAYSFGGNLYDFYFKNDSNLYTENFTVPQAPMKDIPMFLGNTIIFNGDYSDTSDIKLSGSGINMTDATLYIASDTDTISDPVLSTSVTHQEVTNLTAVHDTGTPRSSQSSLILGRLTVKDTGDFYIRTRSFTCMFWAKLGVSGNYRMFEEGNDDNWFIGWNSGTFTLGYFNDDVTTWSPSGYTGLDDNTWHHYYIGSDGNGTLYTFLDGTNKQTYSYTTFGRRAGLLSVGSSLGGEVFQMSTSGLSNSGINQGFSVRQYLPASIVTNESGSMIRCSFYGAPSGLHIEQAYIGIATDSLTFDGNQVKLTFQGNDGVTVGDEEKKYSDWVALNIDTSSDDILITRDHLDGIDSEYKYVGTPSGAVGSFKDTGATLESQLTSVSGYSSYSPRVYGVYSVDITSGVCHANDLFYLADTNIYTNDFTPPSQLMSENPLYKLDKALYISQVTLTSRETNGVSVWTP